MKPDYDVALRTAIRSDTYEEVLELIESEISKAKERGDFTTAETIEVIRAKVKAQGEKK